jgi:hypothetical protein
MRHLVFAAVLCLSAGVLSAQTLGSLTGEIKDPSGAVAPNVAVTLTNVATNGTRNNVTNGAGIYSFPDIEPADYRVTLKASGFETISSTFTLQVEQHARLDFSLVVGQATQTIEVSGVAATLNTEDATVGTVIEEKRIVDLPLSSRDFFQLVALSPNVNYGFTAPAQASGREGGTRASITISTAGSRSAWQNYTLDGVTNTDIDFNLYIILPSIDMIQEFKSQSGVYPAEFGRDAGQVNVSTKSGTNNLHGAVFDFLRNIDLDARGRNFILPVATKNPYQQNQFGFAVGGPVWIPKVYNGKNKLFWETNWEGLKIKQVNFNTSTFLTPAMRSGDFSAFGFPLYNPNSRTCTAAAGSTCPISTPVSTVGGTGTQTYTAAPFPNNQIPVSMFPPSTATFLAIMPLPNGPGSPNQPGNAPIANNYTWTGLSPTTKWQYNQRVDWNENSNTQWFGRYSWTTESLFSPGATGFDGSLTNTSAQQWVVSNTHIFSPTKVNEARWGYSKLQNTIAQQLAGVTNFTQELGIPISLTTGSLWGIPQINMGESLSGFGNSTNGPYIFNNKYHQFVDNFTWTLGKHAVRFGGEYRHNEFPSFGNEYTRGSFTYNGDYTADPTGAGTNKASPGYIGADFLLGDFDQASMAVSAANTDYTSNEWALYIDDTWKVTPKLTVTAGLRWEVAQPLLDTDGNMESAELRAPAYNYQTLCAPNCGPPGAGLNVANLALHPIYDRTGTNGNYWQGVNFINPALAVERNGQYGARLVNTYYKNFAPRLGVAYSPNSKWVIRTGFGIFYDQESKNSIFDTNRNQAGRFTSNQNLHIAPTFTYTNFISTASLPFVIDPSGLSWGVDPQLPTTYTEQWLMNVQRQFGTGTTIEAGYNGNMDIHTDYLTNQNQALPGYVGLSLPTIVPYPELNAVQYLVAQGTGNYNGLGVKVTQKLGKNATLLAGYTWSKAMTQISAIRGSSGSFSPQNNLCRNCDTAVADFNVPQRLVISALYTIPTGKGQRYLNHGGIVNQIVGGWQTSSIFTMQSGAPVNLASGLDALGNTGYSPDNNRMNCTGINPLTTFNNQTDQYLNVAAFANQVAIPGSYATEGTCGQNAFRAMRWWNWDASAIKDFQVKEGQKLQLRVEGFNPLNHVAIGGGPSGWGTQTTTPSPTFGITRGTSTGQRIIQVALKYVF